LLVLAGLAVAVPNLAGAIRDTRLDAAASDVIAHLCRARARAVTENVPVRVVVRRRWIIVLADRDGDGLYAADEQSMTWLEEPADLQIGASDTHGTFRPPGTFQCETGYWTIGLSSGRRHRKVVYVFPSGRVERSGSTLLRTNRERTRRSGWLGLRRRAADRARAEV
jgi:Tfp pilus assembly protein FimT